MERGGEPPVAPSESLGSFLRTDIRSSEAMCSGISHEPVVEGGIKTFLDANCQFGRRENNKLEYAQFAFQTRAVFEIYT